jgi:hypothetical protein
MSAVACTFVEGFTSQWVGMQRRLEIDAARGLMLVWMTLTHLPTIVSTYVNQPFGFVSGAEGFIFLSALFTGRTFSLLAEREGNRAMASQLWMRALRLYLYHLVLLALAFLVLAKMATGGTRPGLHNLLDFYFTAPRQAPIAGALLIYRPPLLDILPMYITFLLFTPLALMLARKIGWKMILSAGFILWLSAQFGLRQAVYDFSTQVFGLRMPLSATGAFDLFAWQFMWLVGVYCGVRWSQNDLPVEKWARRILIPAIIMVPVLFALRYSVGRGIELGMLEVSFDKWHLGIVRMINFAAVAALLIQCQAALKQLAIRPLVTMGQASLQVFCAHLLFCFIGLAIMRDAPIVNGWQEAALITLTLSGMWLTAKIFSRKRPATVSTRALSRPVTQFGD